MLIQSSYWRFLERVCEKHHLRLNLTLEVREKYLLLTLVANGMGVSIVPRHIAETGQETLCIVPISDLAEELPIVVAFQPHSPSSMLPAFLEVLRHRLELRVSNLSPQKLAAGSVQ
jgi:DNA-binding transcriptional LysR family regulator